MKTRFSIWPLLYISAVLAANWAFVNLGTVAVAPGLNAPAAVLFVGLIFTFRDFVQENDGVIVVFLCIFAGGLLSYLLASPVVAGASLLAFLVSETLDFSVYTPLRRWNFYLGVSASNVVGALVDSWIFLSIVGALGFFAGQVVGKILVTAATLVVLALLPSRWKPRVST